MTGQTRTNKKQNRNNKSTTRKGGSLSFFSRKKDTTVILTDLHEKVGNIKLKDMESTFLNNINKLESRKAECVPLCLKACSDDVTRDQLKHMMANGTFYDWGNICGHSLDVKKCREFIHTYTKLDTYNKYVSSLSKNLQNHFDKLTRKMNEEHLGNTRAVNPMSKSSSKSKSKSRSSSRSVFSPNQNILSRSSSKSNKSNKSNQSNRSSRSSRISDYSFKSLEP
jgi:hypothetical protein